MPSRGNDATQQHSRGSATHNHEEAMGVQRDTIDAFLCWLASDFELMGDWQSLDLGDDYTRKSLIDRWVRDTKGRP